MRLSIVVIVIALASPCFADDGAVRAARLEVDRSDGQRAQLASERDRLASGLKTLAATIDAEKARPSGVARDLALGELLARAKAQSDQLDALERRLGAATQEAVTARRALVAVCDRTLAAELPSADRVALMRLRTAQVTLLTALSSSNPVGRVASAVGADPLDGPRQLREKADLLRDSVDKLHREAQKLSARIDDVERRRHLRERASAVDEDLFGDSTWSRRGAAPAGSSLPTGSGNASQARGSDSATPTPSLAGGAVNAPTSGNGNSFANNQPPATPSSDASLRNLVDPATLAELRRADGADDLDAKVRALRRAQSELEGLARDLDGRAKTLSRRADQLKDQK